MAEATALRNNALPYPIYGAPYTLVFPILDADGDLVTGAAALDSEISKNGDTGADCTNEATEIATSSGLYYLSLTGTELTADVVAGITKTSTSGAKTSSWSLYPRKLVTVHSGTAAGGDTGYITLDAGASTVDDYYNGMVVIATIDSNVEVRVISDYTGSSKQAAVTPAWNVTPDADDTFVVKLPEGAQMPQAGLTAAAVDAILDEVIEGSYTLRQYMRGFAAVLLGKSTNNGADFRDTADSKTRVDSTLDANSNRTAVTLDLT